MPKRYAFVDDDTTVALEVLENRLRVSGGLDDLDALLDGSLSIGQVVGGVNGGKHGDVDAELGTPGQPAIGKYPRVA
jgi:hypothetical protein